MRVRVRTAVPAAAAQALDEDGETDTDDEQTRDERQPRIEGVGNDELGQHERDETEREHAGGMRDCDGGAEQHGVARTALRADEVAGDERLAVTRRQCVHGAPERRDQQRDTRIDSERQVASGDQRREAVSATRSGAWSDDCEESAGAGPAAGPAVTVAVGTS